MSSWFRAAVAAAAAFAASCAPAPTPPAKPTVVMSTVAFKSVLEELRPGLARAGTPIDVRYEVAAVLKARIEKGEAHDVALLTAAAIDDLVKQGHLKADTRATLARSGIGVAIARGAPKPDLSSEAGLRKALLGSKAIVYSTQGATGPNMKKIFERMGITAEMAAKTKTVSEITAPQSVGRGEAEMGFTQVSEILDEPNSQFAGPLPAAVQVYTTFAGAVSSKAANPQGAAALMKAMASADTTRVLQAKGMERP